jgi:hypothetical protein
MTEVWAKAPFKRSDLLILLALADSANDEGVCWPSIATLAKRGRINRRNTYAALGKLEEAGWLERTSREGRSTIYTVIIGPEETTQSDPESVAHDTQGASSMSPTTGVVHDTPVPEDTGGVSPTTGGGVAGDTQNRKEPSSEPPPPPYFPGGMQRAGLPWYPLQESVDLARATYDWATDVVLREVTGEFIHWITVKAKQRATIAQLNEDKEKYSGIWFSTFLAKESENRERAARDEAAAREPRKDSWFAVAGD